MESEREMMKRNLALLSLLTVFASVEGIEPPTTDLLSGTPQYIRYAGEPGSFALAEHGKAAPICVSPEDWPGVIRAAKDLSADIGRVSGTAAEVRLVDAPEPHSIIVGTADRSPLIRRLVEAGKIDVSQIEGRWESFLIEVADDSLVVVGSDKRGCIYGIYDVSEKIGVSPWHWWADVPVRKSPTLHAAPGRFVQPPPKVKWRGIFINDEWPSFGGWTSEKFGGFNAEMHAHLFELLLRLKANFFWPAMWSAAFNEDDPRNPELADEYGIVMGTSHHEPMMRAHQEYVRRRDAVGPWDYSVNKERLDRFFEEGFARNRKFENVVTIGMRGDGDVAMGKGDDEENMKTLRQVMKGQREIIRRVTGAPPEETPQLWAVFTEVQRYYDKGFEVPDDVLLLFCDNNWGFIRRAGPEKERKRKGGMGLYYHIDMNGGPWNDRWVNAAPIPKLREQLHLAYETGLDDLWVVNVGDLKPKELPIDFILRYAWNPDAVPADKTRDYVVQWCAQNFGDEFAEDAAEIVVKYPKWNLWRKPETQIPGIYSVVNHREADRVDALWRDLTEKAESLRRRLPAECADAYYQLAYYPAVASACVSGIYDAATRNRLYAKQGRPSANRYARQAEELFRKDEELARIYNEEIAGGKWKRMMSDVHVGYSRWSMPEKPKLPELKRVELRETPSMGVAAEGCEQADEALALPTFDSLSNQTHFIDVFNRGKGAFSYEATANRPWVRIENGKGSVETETRLQVGIDWERLDDGEHQAVIEIRGGDETRPVAVRAVKGPLPATDEPYFGNLAGSEFSIPAHAFSANKPGKNAAWTFLPDLGRGKGCMGATPVTAPSATPPDAPCLEYRIFLPKAGDTLFCIGILPTQDVRPERGLRLAASIDDGEALVVDARQGFVDEFKEYTPENLAKSPNLKPLPKRTANPKLIGQGMPMRTEVFDNLRWLTVVLPVKSPGLHVLKIFMVDPEIVLERIVVNPDDRHPSYFGAPPAIRNAETNETPTDSARKDGKDA